MKSSLFVFASIFSASAVFAGNDLPSQAVPLPGALALVAIGAVAGIVATIRSRRK